MTVAKYKLTGSDALGKDPIDVLKVAKLVERTAKIIWGARLLGEPVPLPKETLEQFAPIYKLVGRLQ